ncbi:hypothetical protein IMF23_08605 [Chelatococcus daeguensis]|uniref:Lipoprotein n=2 Tax=Chelatococcus TaxID=28209 RepID=A0A840C650_9HYPH|nr:MULTISPECIES: hypothetical protein [Chelatococcus]KZE28533.1 hypothetical protein AVW15_06975 [Chelatococcus daeguensis]MBB4017877.1 hypothetical protein [Chelatococcus caeni]MBM3083491.1 hypothetical protein [Chelatococcus daeguensis]CUA84087.1 hypothetical protein Ga0061061_101179 [Chelatococcus sambhunathii]
MTIRALPTLFGATVLALSLAACNTTGGSPTQQQAAATPAVPQLPGDSACAREINTFREITRRDVDTGYLSPTVYAKMTPEVDKAASTCTSGADRDAVAMLAATKSRYGYR